MMPAGSLGRLQRRPIGAGLPLAAAIAIACSIFSSPADAQSESPPIIVAGTPNDSSGAIFYAQDLGLFKKLGLNIKVEPFENPGTVAAAVVGGSVTIGTLSIPGIAIAREKGLPIGIVAGTAIYSSAAPTSAVIVLKASPIKRASDLDGKTIATRDIGNLAYYATMSWVDKNGGDSKSLKWVEINETATVAALLAGRIQAAVVAEPGLDTALHGPDARMFAPIYDGIGNKFLIGASFTTLDYAKAHPDIVRKFVQALIEAGTWANTHQPQSAKIVEKYAGVPIPPGTTRVTYAERVCPADAQPVLNMLQRYGALKSSMSATDLFAPEVVTTPCH